MEVVNNTVVLMRMLTFIFLTAVIFGFVALDTTFKEMEAHRQEFNNLQEALNNNPLDDLSAAGESTYPVEESVQGQSGIPVIGPIIDFFADVGRAIWGFIQTVVTFISAGVRVVSAFIGVLSLFFTFSFPGIPIEVQFILWSVNLVMWMGILYIGFRAIRGGG